MGEWDALQSFLYDPGAKGNKDPLIATKTGVDLESINFGWGWGYFCPSRQSSLL